jgi:hypothetical protein
VREATAAEKCAALRLRCNQFHIAFLPQWYIPFCLFSELEHSSGAEKKFYFEIQKANGVAPKDRQRYKYEHHSLKSSFRSVGPRFSASVPACIFFRFPFHRSLSQCSNRGNLTCFFSSTEPGVFCIIIFCFPISKRPPGPCCMWSITVKCARPNPACQPPSCLPPLHSSMA